MKCPECDYKTSVVDSRRVEDTVFRRRLCTRCKYRFYTEELTIEDEDIVRNYHRKIRQDL